MAIARKIIGFYRLDNPFEQYENDYWRLRLINVFLILTHLVYTFFLAFNLIVTHLYANATIDAIGLVVVHGIIYDFRRKRQVQRTSHFTVLNVFILSAAIIFVSEKDFGILFWSIFLPIFAMLLMGKRIGLFYSAGYYIIIIAHLLSSIGNEITSHLVIEFTIVSVILVSLIYYYESSRIQAYEQLEKRSLEDPLTGLYNRRHFDRVFATEFNRLRRSDEPFAFFIMDIDHFKRFNDQYGHHEGDLALKSVSDILNAYMRRSGEVCFRIGGEEFGGIINCQNKREGASYVEQIRRAIQELSIDHSENESFGVVTASFGFVVIEKYEGLSCEQVYKMSDKALYRAKASGRNCVETVSV